MSPRELYSHSGIIHGDKHDDLTILVLPHVQPCTHSPCTLNDFLNPTPYLPQGSQHERESITRSSRRVFCDSSWWPEEKERDENCDPPAKGQLQKAALVQATM
jgi:hypothetical protein